MMNSRFLDGVKLIESASQELAKLIKREKEEGEWKQISQFLRVTVWDHLAREISRVLEKELEVDQRKLQFKYCFQQLAELKKNWEEQSGYTEPEYVVLLTQLRDFEELMEHYSPKYGPQLQMKLNKEDLRTVLRECTEIRVEGEIVFGSEEEEKAEFIKEEGTYLIQPKFGTQIIASYNLDTKIGLESVHQNILPYRCGFCHLANCCYIGGGKIGDQKLTNCFYSIDHDMNVIELSPLLGPKRSHLAMAALNLSNIVTSGGRKDIALVVAQQYSVKTNTWIELPEMNHRRASHSLCAFIPQSAIYAIFGDSDTGREVSSIESFKRHKWRLLEIEGDELPPSCRMFSHALPEQPHIILWSQIGQAWNTFRMTPSSGQIFVEAVEMQKTKEMSGIQTFGDRLICSQAQGRALWEWRNYKWRNITSEFTIYN